MNRPTPDPSQEGSRQSLASGQFPSWEGLGVGSWSQCKRQSDRRLSMNRVRKREQAPRTPNAAAQWPNARDFAEHLECVRLAGAFHGSWKVRAASGSRCFGVAKRPAGKAFSAGMKGIGLALLRLLVVTDTLALAGTLEQFRPVFRDIVVVLYD